MPGWETGERRKAENRKLKVEIVTKNFLARFAPVWRGLLRIAADSPGPEGLEPRLSEAIWTSTDMMWAALGT